ncbi:MAG: peptide chain release factor H [Desulfobacteraceae bacterium]|jgi:peptide chain release factor
MINWIQITSGRGPLECCWVVTQLIKCITLEAGKKDIKIQLLECLQSEKPGIYKSVLLAIEGDNLKDFIQQWKGTAQWIGNSMFRKNHKRKNWFVGINCLVPPTLNDWNEKEVRCERMKASGPGGQHVNKTESAIRAIHLPTGIKAVAQEERSQHLNKKLAMTRLSILLKEKEDKIQEEYKLTQWREHNKLERGNPVRIYKGIEFRLDLINKLK